MKQVPRIKLVREGGYLAELEVNLWLADDEWSPYLSVEDAYKLDDVREALRQGDLATASQYGRLFALMPVAV